MATNTYKVASRQQHQDQLVLDNLEFVRHLLGKLVCNLPEDVDVENLESAGILGLVEAAQQFDPDRGVPFRSFAYSRIRGAIIDELRRNCPLPQRVLQHISIVRAACENLEPPVTPERIVKMTGLSLEQVETCLQATRLTRPTVWDETLAYQKAKQRERDDTEFTELKSLLADCISELPEQDRIVITLYYLEDMRLKEIGATLSLSESRVSRIKDRAEVRLAAAMRERGG